VTLAQINSALHELHSELALIEGQLGETLPSFEPPPAHPELWGRLRSHARRLEREIEILRAQRNELTLRDAETELRLAIPELKPVLSTWECLADVRHLTPELVAHLQRQTDHLERLDPLVFEQLVAELLLTNGWSEVRLVGKNPSTSADIFAGYCPGPAGIHLRCFVEVKRWKSRIGVEVFNQVMGAMMSERDRWGWHLAMIVALGGASETRKFTLDEWRLKGIEVREKSDLLRWLQNYTPSSNGLWLPPCSS
jgi:Restriction endonuclease